MEISDLLDFTRGAVNQWLSGRLIPGHKLVTNLFEIYPELSADYLLLGGGEMIYEDKISNKTNLEK